MRINFNASAVIANNALNRNDTRLQESLGRLSSGLKVVNAKDNPSGLAMSKRMHSQIEGLDMASQNSSDGVSIIEIADGTLSEIHDMLQRMNELANKGANGILTDDDRSMLDAELQQLKEEVTRISKETEFNGQKLLDGSFDLKGYTDNTNVSVSYYGDKVLAGEYKITGAIEWNDPLITDPDPTIEYDPDKGTISNADDLKACHIKITNNGVEKEIGIKEVDGNIITFGDENNFELKLRVKQTASITNTNLNLEGFGAMDMQIGANEGQQLAIRIPEMSLENMGISNIEIKTKTEADGSTTNLADEAMNKIDGAIKYVSAARSRLGAYQNRLEHTISSLDISSENMTAAYSRIMDVDMAKEMTEYTTVQVLSQASTSMLAQANERPSQVLQLLQ